VGGCGESLIVGNSGDGWREEFHSIWNNCGQVGINKGRSCTGGIEGLEREGEEMK